MDGNGRWAQQKSLPRVLGHREGARSVRRIVTYAREIGIRYLTLYAFSTENWGRPELEVGALMMLLRDYLEDERPTILKNNIKLSTIGATERLPGYVRDPLVELMRDSSDNTGMTLTLALSYSGREEITRATRALAEQVARGELKPESITADMVANRLDTAGMPDPDLLIRTSGELRISNFMLWQLAYTELYITQTLWPDFDESTLNEALRAYQGRTRRFGKTTEQVLPPDASRPAPTR
ncbi:MAG: isoprenyl transferase [Deltaproteobacteria bacterium]|nr:isoprenyl transferase [Deltaproteobacteria bacterium]